MKLAGIIAYPVTPFKPDTQEVDLMRSQSP